MVPNILAHDDPGGGQGADPIPSPFLIDDEALSHPGRRVDARVRWRGSVLAVARKMLAEDGYRAFSLRRLSAEGNTSPQNIYNNVGAKDDVILQALLSYNRVLLTQDHGEYCTRNLYVRLIAARHKMTIHYPEYVRAVHDTLFSNTELSRAMQSETINLIAPYVKSVLHDHHVNSMDYMQISRLLATVARNAARDWANGACSAYEMFSNSIADGEICLLGALFKSEFRKAGEGLYDLGFSQVGVSH